MKRIFVAFLAAFSVFFSFSAQADEGLAPFAVTTGKQCTILLDLSFEGGAAPADFSEETITYIKEAVSARGYTIAEGAFKDEQGNYHGDFEFRLMINYSRDEKTLFGDLINIHPGEYRPYSYVYLKNGKDRFQEAVGSRLKGMKARMIADLIPNCETAH